MNDVEEILRRTFGHYGRQAPAPDDLLDTVRTKVEKHPAAQRWIVPIAASVVTALLVVAIATQGFAPGESETSTSTTSTPAPSPTSSESTRVIKCQEPPGLHNLAFAPEHSQDIVVTQGQRLLLRGVDGFCQRTVTFNGKHSSPSLRSDPPFTGADWLRAVTPGVVTVAVFQPMCVTAPPTPDGCLGGLARLGSITVTVERRRPAGQPTRVCRADDFTLTGESGPGTAAERVWATIRLREPVDCRLNGRIGLTITDTTGVTVAMPNNPLTWTINEPLRKGRPVVVSWDWAEPFCGRQFPYAAEFELLDRVDRLREVTTPSCPTEVGDPPTNPRGLRLHSVEVLR